MYRSVGLECAATSLCVNVFDMLLNRSLAIVKFRLLALKHVDTLPCVGRSKSLTQRSPVGG
jgi:hypothetical protein